MSDIDGFNLPEGKTITDTDFWKPFKEWFEKENGFESHPTIDRAVFETWVAGAYWQWHKTTFHE